MPTVTSGGGVLGVGTAGLGSRCSRTCSAAVPVLVSTESWHAEGRCAVHARWCAVRAHPLAEHPVREAALRLAHVRFTADARHQARPRVAAGAQQLLQSGLGLGLGLGWG